MDLARLDGVHRSTFGSTNSNTGGEMDEPRSSRLVAVSSSQGLGLGLVLGLGLGLG